MLRLAAACAAALTVAAPAGAHTDGGTGLSLVWPISGTVTRGFDIGTLRTLDVRAAAPGVVEAVGETPTFEGYGNIVLVDLGDGIEALYAHLSDARVKVGDTVETGQKLGVAGCTGYCTGTHLHFEVREDGEAIDPAPLLPATIPAPEGG